MRHWAAVLPVLAVALSLFAAAPATTPAKKKTTPKRRAAPPPARVSAAAKAAALRAVDDRIEQSTPGTFEQPGALVPVLEQLHRLATGPERTAVHILHFGDSHTAADDWTGGLRDLLKQRFGDGGAGFALAGRPFLGYRRFDIRGGATPYWQTSGLRSALGDGYFGLGGVSITATRARESVYVDTECDHLEVDYLQQPGGGAVALYDGADLVDTIATDGDLRPGFISYDTSPGPHRFQLRTVTAAPVRLFGWAADRAAGVTYEALGINGAEASVMLKWNPEILATYLHRRNPGMIVLAYGTNEASDPNWLHESYEGMLGTLLARLREDAPAATILLLGPPDRWSRTRAGWHTLAGVDAIVEAERNACRANGCAFWDTRRRMGGRGSMRDWVYAGLAQQDYVHFTSSGYRRIAELLYQDLIREYETYVKVRAELPHGNAN